MANLEKVKLDEKLLASLEQILDLNSVTEPTTWHQGAGDTSPPFLMSPNSPGSPMSPMGESYNDGEYLIIPSEGGIIHYCDEPSPPDSPRGRKKRGRKPLRPFDPVKKKTEEKDKYWLRAFRSYMKLNYALLRGEMSEEDRLFWKEHLGPDGKPEKGRKYLSYGKKYKDFLFSHVTFVNHFQRWFTQFGESELSKKYPRDTGLWFVFYDFGSKELYNYTPSPDGFSGSEMPFGDLIPPTELFDMAMIDAEEAADALLK